MQLRGYQWQAIQSVWQYFEEHTGNPLIAMPTGTGKSIVIGGLLQEIYRIYPMTRVMVLTHVKELIEQNTDKLLRIWPHAPVGVYSAGLNLRDTIMPIIMGGVASVRNRVDMFGHRDLLIIDEAHLLSPDQDTMYQKIIAELRMLNPRLKVIGLTATWYRLGQGTLTSRGGLFTHICYNLCGIEGFERLISEGWIAPPIAKRMRTTFDVSAVPVVKGEYVQSELQRAVDVPSITHAAIQEICEYGQDRRSWLIFASGIEHAEHCAEVLNEYGVQAAAVHSKMAPSDRDDRIRAFREGRLRAITNNNILTTGFDHEPIDLIGMLRPTVSPGLWVQMLGRGTRPYEGKRNCIAEGQCVLTDHGLVPIELVNKSMKVWDGVEYVEHGGLVFSGVSKCITYAGLTATPDHQVWTQEGWKTLWECAAEQTSIAVTEFEGQAIRLFDCSFRRGNQKKESLLADTLCELQFEYAERVHEFDAWNRWMSSMLKSAFGSEVALCSLSSRTVSLLQFIRQALFGLWWSRYRISIFLDYGYGNLYNGSSQLFSSKAIRSYREQLALRSWKSKMVHCFREYAQPSISQRRVYDILNAGPRNRFTVNGLLAHNCLVLDFAGNTARLGPIDDPVIPKAKGNGTGDVPVKICPVCGAFNHTRVKFCVDCGAEFEFKQQISRTADDQALLSSGLPQVELFVVDRVMYNRHEAYKTGRISIKISYLCGLRMFNEWISFDSTESFVRHKANEWWRQAMPDEPPLTNAEALTRISQARVPSQIRVWINTKYPKVLSHVYS